MSVCRSLPSRRGQGSPTLKALDGVVSFITDWKQPKGPIRIAITPAKTAGMADLEKVMEPNGLTDGARPDGRLRGNARGRGDRRTAGRRAGTGCRPAGRLGLQDAPRLARPG